MNQLDVVREILLRDRIWSVYALADLQPALLPHCRWLVAEDESGLVLIFAGLEPPVLLSAGRPESVAAALAQAAQRGELPPRVYLSTRGEHLPAIQAHYDNSADRRPMIRMALRQLTATGSGARLRRLGVDDAGRLRRLYAYGGPFTPDAFAPFQLEEGIFYGVDDDNGELVAAGGTHIVSWVEGVGAIGNVYTRPDQRGRGLAKAITAAIVQTLQEVNVQTIILNVDERNRVAKSLYEKLGFEEYCPYVEGIAVKRGA